MRFKSGLLIGFGAGYYLGAKAGRTRYLQMREWVDKVRPAVDLGMERARDLVEKNDDPTVIDLASTARYSPSR